MAEDSTAPPGSSAGDSWDDLWENQGKATPPTVGALARAMSQAANASPRAHELPLVVELYDNTGGRRRLTVTGISFTGSSEIPDAVTITVVTADLSWRRNAPSSPAGSCMLTGPIALVASGQAWP